MSKNKSTDKNIDVAKLQSELEQLKQQLNQAHEQQNRALADYQNLIRRTQEDRAKFIKMANQDLVLALLQPLDHLGMAVEQLQDKGLNLAFDQLWRSLKEFGLEPIEVTGQKFDVNTMEAAEGSQGDKVVKVVRPGYKLNGMVVQHAKVLLG